MSVMGLKPLQLCGGMNLIQTDQSPNILSVSLNTYPAIINHQNETCDLEYMALYCSYV